MRLIVPAGALSGMPERSRMIRSTPQVFDLDPIPVGSI
jgi:hypothetical protein